MPKYVVTYELRSPASYNDNQFSSRSDLKNLRMTVDATSSGQAMMMVESMNGGGNMCRASSAYPA